MYLNHNGYNRKSLRRTVDPATPVVTTATLKTFLKIDGSDEDTILDQLIASATNMAEVYTRRAFITQTFKLTMDRFDASETNHIMLGGQYDLPDTHVFSSGYVELMRPPIQSVTSITTYATDNSSSVFASSNYTLGENDGRIYLDIGSTFPASLRDKNAVEIIYIAGYGDAATDVPDAIVTGVMFQAANMYENRSCAALTNGVMDLLNSYRLYDDLMT